MKLRSVRGTHDIFGEEIDKFNFISNIVSKVLIILFELSKKIKVVEDIRKKLNMSNVITINDRAENHHLKYDFVISRAVSKMDKFYSLVKNNIKSKSKNSIPNGIISLKGGDLESELKQFNNFKVFEISKFFSDHFFQTKKIVYIPFPN